MSHGVEKIREKLVAAFEYTKCSERFFTDIRDNVQGHSFDSIFDYATRDENVADGVTEVTRKTETVLREAFIVIGYLERHESRRKKKMMMIMTEQFMSTVDN